MSADLHIHTNYSDGFLDPKKVVEIAKKVGLKTISITDHDSVGAIDPALIAGKDLGVEVIPGVELNTRLDKLEVHILGYFIDYKDLWFKERLAESRQIRIQRAQQMIEKLNNLHVDIEFEEVEKLAGHSSIGRPHLARILCEHGYTDSVIEAFNKYLRVGAPAYVGLVKWNPFEAIEAIRKVNGIPVLAHPGSYKVDDLIPEMVSHGLQGIEIYCTKHSNNHIEHYLELAKNYNLLITGGSDFHNALGDVYDAILGSIPLADEHVDKLRAAAKEMVLRQDK
ncbi:MAG: PHP domain-containing protein [Candidatus Margulisbacteria bacterium]|nr:PHP domain-containing protein [Candidatus Margulisiibacteriota bacterium]